MNMNEEMRREFVPKGWTEKNIPSQSGKRFLITGGTSGLGMASARALVNAGADVTITARSLSKAKEARSYTGDVKVLELDLTDLSSVRRCADQINAGPGFDIVMLNAGIMAPPLAHTRDGFESQLGTNHLGHFALAGLIRGKICGRVVSIASQAHRMGNFRSGSVDDIRDMCLGKGQYSPWGHYGASKLANILFTLELERRRIINGWPITPVVAHPGWSATHLFKQKNGVAQMVSDAMGRVFAQSAERGALPQLCAATIPYIVGGSYLGPRGIGEMRGTPTFVYPKAMAYDQVLAKNLWTVSEELTGVKWEN